MAAPAIPASSGHSELSTIDMEIEKKCSEDKEFDTQYRTNKKRIDKLIDHILDIISVGQTKDPEKVGKLLAGKCTVIVETKPTAESPSLILGEIPDVAPLVKVPLMAKMIKLSMAIQLAVKTKVFNSEDMRFLPDLKTVACRLIPADPAGDSLFSVVLI